MKVEGNPIVKNRRKFPRLSLSNACEVTLKSGDVKRGIMVNLSANGLSFITEDHDLKMGELLKFQIKNFAIQKSLPAVAIRKAILANGSTQYSCRMLDDDMDIAAYIDARL